MVILKENLYLSIKIIERIYIIMKKAVEKKPSRFVIAGMLLITSLNVSSPNYLNVYEYEGNSDSKINSNYFREVTVTMYNPVPSQTNSEPYITADLSNIDKDNPSKHNWIAISYNLHRRYGGYLDFGDTIYLYGTAHKDEKYVVKDLMNSRYENRIDILESKGEELYKFENCLISTKQITGKNITLN